MRHLAFSLAFGVLWGPAASAGAPAYGDPELLRFANGLQVVLQPHSGGQSVAAVIRVAGGWSSDPEHASGTAHLVEHLWFRRQLEGTDLWTAGQARGCDLLATTSGQATTYESVCPADEVDFLVGQVLDGLADPLRGVDEAAVALEVAIVDQEGRERADASRMVARAMYGRLLPPEHVVHGMVAEPDLEAPALTRAHVREWVAGSYTGARTVVGITGSFERDPVVARLTEAFGAPVGGAVSATDEAPAPEEPAAPHVSGTGSLGVAEPLPALAYGWNLPRVLADSAAFSIAATHLGARLDDAVEDESDVLGASCGMQSVPEAPALVCTVSLSADAEVDADLTRRIDRAVERAWAREGQTALRKRLRRAKAEAPQDLLLSHARPLTRARRFVRQVSRGEAPTTVEAAIRDLRHWKPQYAGDLAARWLTPERAARLELKPDLAPVAGQARPWRGAAPVDPPMPVALDAPSDGPSIELASRTLDSGLRVVGIHREDSPYVRVSVRLPGGTGSGPRGLTSLAEALTTGPRTKEAWGVRTGHHVGRDHIEVSAVAPPRQLDRALQAALSEVRMRMPMVDASREEDEDLERYLRRRRESAQAAGTTASWQASDALERAVTPEHDPTLGLQDEDLQAARSIDASSLLAYLWRTYQPTRALVVVTGSQSAERLVARASRHFEEWKLRQGIAPQPYAPARPASSSVPLQALVHDPSSKVAVLDWRCRLPDPGTRAERAVLTEAVETVLWTELRHRRGYVYTPWAGVDHWPDGTAVLRVLVEVPPDRAAAALEQVDRVGDHLVGAVPGARERRLRRLALQLESVEGVETLVQTVFEEEGPTSDPVRARRSALDGVDASALAAELQTCAASRSYVVRGPLESIRHAMASAGYTPVDLEAP